MLKGTGVSKSKKSFWLLLFYYFFVRNGRWTVFPKLLGGLLILAALGACVFMRKDISSSVMGFINDRFMDEDDEDDDDDDYEVQHPSKS